MTEIHKIQEKVEYAKDRFGQYLNSLVGLGAKKATTREIQLFNLEEAYDDGVLRRDELNHLRFSFQTIDFDKLVSERKILYNSAEKKLEYRINTFDFNRDGVKNAEDKEAINYVINFFNNNVNTLTDMLELAGDKQGIAKYNIKSWAIARGMEEGTAEHDAFVNKFYDQFYANPEVQAPIELLGKVLNLYDAGLGKDNLDELNDYVLLLKENQPVRLLADFHRFTKSDAFNVPDAERQAMKDKIISALLNKNVPERQKLVADSIARRKIAILGDDLTAQSLSSFIDRTDSKDAIALMRIEQIAKKIGLENQLSRTDDEYDQFVDKFFNDYYISHEKGLSISDVSNLARFYTRLKAIKGDDFKLDDLDVYHYALDNSSGARFYVGDLNLLLNLDRNAEEYGLTDPIREATLKNYADIISGSDPSDKRSKDFLKLALRTGKIPLTGEELTIDKLNSFLNIAADDASYVDLVITQMANNREIFDNPANPNDEFDRFKSNFTDYAKNFSSSALEQKRVITVTPDLISNLNFLATLYDGDKIDFDQLDIFAVQLRGRASKIDLRRLANTYKTDVFNVVGKAEKLREYAEILSSGNKEKKQMVSAFLRTGTIPLNPIKKEDVTLKDLDETLAKIDEEGGMLELRIKQLARKSGIDDAESPAEFNNFVNTMTSWHDDKNISFQHLNMLAGFYKNTDKDLSDLSIYADALENGVKGGEVAVIFSFENSEEFDLIGAGRDAKIKSYLDILAKPPETSADRERKSILINSIRGKKIYLTGEDLTIDTLDSILARTTTEDAIFDIQSDLWASKLEFPVGSGKYNSFKDTVFALKNDDNLNNNSISRSLSFLKNFPGITFDDFGSITQALSRSRKNTATIRNIVSFVQGEDFSNTTTSSSYKSQKLNDYLNIIQSGNQLEKQVLKSAVKSGKVYITEKDISVTNLEEALNIAASEDDYTLQEVKRLANNLEIDVGSADYIRFKRKFYDGLYKEEKLSLTDLRYLAGFYSRGVFSDAAFSELVQARKLNISTKALRNLEKYANVTEMSQTELIAYLQILNGAQGNTKKQFLTQVFASNFIPIANTRLF